MWEVRNMFDFNMQSKLLDVNPRVLYTEWVMVKVLI